MEEWRKENKYKKYKEAEEEKDICKRIIFNFLIIMMAELNENFYSSKSHKYPPSSFLLLLGNSNCGMQ